MILEYDDYRIEKDTIEKCYVKNPKFYNLSYNEYLVNLNLPNNYNSSGNDFILDSKALTFTPIDQVIQNKILTDEHSTAFFVHIKNNESFSIINTEIVNNILDSLISPENKSKYKKLVNNILVEPTDKIIFYDYNECLLTTWITDILISISKKSYVHAIEYYDNKNDFKKLLKKHKYRCAIISNQNYTKKSIEKQIEDFDKLGFRNIIVKQYYNNNSNMYNLKKFKRYLHNNEKLLCKYIKDEINYDITDWKQEIHFDDDIFSNKQLLFTNFLKWCCE